MNNGTCPVCDGTKQLPLTEDEKRYSWNRDRTHRDCHNCGGQYMMSRASGKVRLNLAGVPCTHAYTSSNDGRCLTGYKCTYCNDRYQIDSGD